MEVKKERISGVELVKIIAIFSIIIFHVTSTLVDNNLFINMGYYGEYYLIKPANNISDFLIMVFLNLGFFGNYVFIIASSYFMANMKKHNMKKITKLTVNTIIISWIFLLIYLLCRMSITNNEIMSSIFPLTFKTNWFITMYLVFCITVPYLNIIVEKLNKKQLCRMSFICFVLYFVIGYFNHSYDVQNIITFISIYFIINYFKRYMENFWNSKKRCIHIMLFGTILLIMLHFIMNLIGILNSGFQYERINWLIKNNPLVLIIAIALFYLFKQMSFKSKFINAVSSLSLYVYLIHENLLFKTYTRVYIWHYIYEKIGYSYIIIEILTYALLLFIISTIISYIYRITLEKVINRIIEKIFGNNKIKNIFNQMENII